MEIKLDVISDKLQGLWQPHRLKIIYGGRGSGKSMAVAEFLVISALSGFERILCAREIQKSIKESSKRLLEETAERLGVSNFFVFQEQSIFCPMTKSEFIFEGLHRNITKIKSMQGITKCWVEEAETTSSDSIQTLFPTIRAKNSEIILTYNPRFNSDPVHEIAMNPPSFAWVQMLNFDDNPYFPEELEQERLECLRINPQNYAWVWEGQVDALITHDSVMLSTWLEDARNRDEFVDKSPKVLGVDVSRFGDDKSCAHFKSNNYLRMVASKDKGDTDDMADWVESIYIEYAPDVIVIDGTGMAGVFDRVNRRLGSKIKVIEYNGAQSPQNYYYANSRAECWGIMAESIRDFIRIDSGKNANYWNDAIQIKYKFAKGSNRKLLMSKDDIKEILKHSPDELDSASLCFHPLIPKEITKKINIYDYMEA